MKLIADSGSTKTDWIILNGSQIIRNIKTEGFNPFFNSSETIYSNLINKFTEVEKNEITQIYFYGAGCIKNVNSSIIENALSKLFVNATINADSDMLGATRALFGSNSGIAGILGTGANSCFYENGEITDAVPTLGYILGDEASAAYLGKKLINHYFKRKLPNDLSLLFEKEYNPIRMDIQNSVYLGEKPNRFLASFAPFLKINSEHEYIQKFLLESFDDFFESNILKYNNYKNYTIGFVGSIAYYFSGFLKEIAKNKGLKISLILKEPIHKLAEYHSFKN